MMASLLITFRETLEAALIIATILSILTKIGYTSSRRTVWLATVSAVFLSIALLLSGSFLCLKVHQVFEEYEAIFEGSVMIISAIFITWAVFFLHKTFAQHKVLLIQKVKATIETKQQNALFMLVFTAVFREGLEIVLFLSTMFFSSQPVAIASGFFVGTGLALIIAYLLFTATLRLPIYQTFRATSVLLILFAAGLLAHGAHELMEAKVIPEITLLPTITLFILPEKSTLIGSLIRSVFGLSRVMHSLELLLWSGYAFIMWHLVLRRKPVKVT